MYHSPKRWKGLIIHQLFLDFENQLWHFKTMESLHLAYALNHTVTLVNILIVHFILLVAKVKAPIKLVSYVTTVR